jgi:hypothetical protein
MPITAFFKRFHLEELVRILTHSYKRFPLPTFLAIASFLLLIAKAHGMPVLDGDALARTLFFFMQGFLYAVSIQVYAESRGLNSAKTAGLILGGYIVLAISVFFPERLSDTHAITTLALALSVIFAPYVYRKSTEDSFWYYNYLNFITLVMAGISALILCLGFSAIIGSVQYLFEISILRQLYGDLWMFGGSLFIPLYFLSQLPKQFDFEKQQCVTPKGIYFIANYLLVPLCLIYMFVLYAYFLKIVLQWSLPRGNLAYMVTGFGIIGILTHLIVYPMQEGGTRLLREFYQHFYKILVVPIVLLAVGIYTRIDQYGLTEERYMVALCLVWFSGLSALYISSPRKAHIKYVPMTLCILALLAIVGPWSAVSLSTTSQLHRLEALLLKTGIIGIDGKVNKASKDISFDDLKNISSLVDYFAEHDRLDKISAWTLLPQEKAAQKHYYPQQKIFAAWGIEYVGRWQRNSAKPQNEAFNVSVPSTVQSANDLVRVAPYEYYTYLQAFIPSYGWTQQKIYVENGKEILNTSFALSRDGNFSLALADGRKVVFPLQPLIEKLYKQKIPHPSEEHVSMMTLHKSENGINILLRIASLNSQLEGGHLVLTGANIAVFFTPESSQTLLK